MASLIETCKLNAVDPYACLRKTLPFVCQPVLRGFLRTEDCRNCRNRRLPYQHGGCMPDIGPCGLLAVRGGALSKVRGSAEGVVEWSRRDPWRERMLEMVEKHLRKACDLNDIDIHDLPDVIGDAALAALNCAFEDCCTAIWEDGSNLCADYLKRRGWKETAMNRAYIEALRDSVVSLHEVSDLRPGESFLARDLVRGGDPVRVSERTATKTLVAWDIVATRIVTVRGVVQMTGAVLPIGRELAEDMLGLLRRTKARAPGMAAETFGAANPALRARLEAELAADEQVLRAGAATITTLWLNDAIRRRRAPPPQLANTDGEPIAFITLHYRLAPNATAADIAEAIAAVPDLRADDEAAHWTWFAPAKPASWARKRKGGADPDVGRTIHGDVALNDGKLEVRVNSEARAARIRAALTPALAGLVREPLIERMTVEQAMAEALRAKEPAPRGLEGVDPGPICARRFTRSWTASTARPWTRRCRCWTARARGRPCAARKVGLPSPTGSRGSSRTRRVCLRTIRCATTISAGCGTSSGYPTFGPERRNAGKRRPRRRCVLRSRRVGIW